MSDKPIEFKLVDVSAQTYGKYQYTTLWKGDGLWYADSDFTAGGGVGEPKKNALPDPRHQDTPALLTKAKSMHEVAAKDATGKAIQRATANSVQETHTLADTRHMEMLPVFAAILMAALIIGAIYGKI